MRFRRIRLRPKSLARVAASIWLVFQLLCVLVGPNRESHVGLWIGKWVEPYSSLLEIGSTWSFFAPDPGPPPIYVEWEVIDRQGKTIERGQLPDSPDPFYLRERQNRRMVMARFMVMSDANTEGVMAPYLCRTRPGAHSVKLWRLAKLIPASGDVVSGDRRPGDEKSADRKFVSRTFCPQKGEGA